MEPPRSDNPNKRHVQITIHLELNPVHLERNKRRRVAPAMHVRLVARNVRVIHHGRVAYHGVHHRRRREARVRPRLLHRRQRLRGSHRPVLPEVEPLREPEAVFHRLLEVLRHVYGRRRKRRRRRVWIGLDWIGLG
ncbi:hypothetical protein PanWU01x14_112350 [Parasponia andersonii]|uniref:Uncharacterized protein n=1 Tax=Parasponia andersonii TaxID=3476 RepID=A0A2P5CY87_PARAD|nr:hypothetical protein PanWU01x14_112350 [Parasponia andersonii]